MTDLPAALAIQSRTYPVFLQEGEAAFASRIALAASYSLAAVQDGKLVAYLLAHGWASRSPPAVGAVLADAAAFEVLFLHDLAVSASGRGTGIGRQLVTAAFARAMVDGVARAELIAVEGASTYWRTLGFAEVAVPAGLAAKVAGYGAAARWMERRVSLPLG